MVVKVYPSASDFENLSRLRTEVSMYTNEFDYSKVVVNKPWGYEYLWYQNPSVAVWMLYVEYGRSTSLHSHLRKRTSLIVISGQVVCSTLENRFKLDVADAIVLEPCVFHATQAISKEGVFLIEVETPPMKMDLVRLKDDFGREQFGYEQQSHYSNDFSLYTYRPFQQNNNAFLQSFGSLNLSLHAVHNRDESIAVCSNKQLIIPFLGRMAVGKATLLETGEAANPNELDFSSLPEIFPPVEILTIDFKT